MRARLVSSFVFSVLFACGDAGGTAVDSAALDADAAVEHDADADPDADVTATPRDTRTSGTGTDTVPSVSGDGYCGPSDPRTSAPDDRACPPLDVGNLTALNPWPERSSETPCCDDAGCDPSTCPEGEICDRAMSEIAVTIDAGAGVCRKPCRSEHAHWTCFSGCREDGIEVTHDCPAGEACSVFDYRFYILEMPRYATLGLCVALPE